MTINSEKLAYSINSFCEASETSRTKVYDEIKAGRLKTVKVGRRRLITPDQARDYFERLAAEQES